MPVAIFATIDILAKTPLLVRRNKIIEALRWLKLNNPLYADLDLDKSNSNAAAYPEHGIPIPPKRKAMFFDEENDSVDSSPTKKRNTMAASVIFASRIPGLGASIDLDTDGIHLYNTVVEGSTLASGAQVPSTASSLTRVNNTGATPTQPQSTTAHTTSFTTEPTHAPTSTASSPLSVPSTSSSSVSQADITCTLPISSSAVSISTANTLAANNVVVQTTTPVQTQPRHSALLLDPLPAKHLLHLVLRLQSVIVPPFHDIIYSNDGNSRNTGARFHYLRRQCGHHH
ncbi:hypothetical protein K435DRAFT_878668 [Dendrothele bispora CBS 962.96]|uniref:DUF6570 domain-containing protein n=1 Tax=Dendrothele bispora (strain CBS 962.96) TaxID=1314807 RepID=A0A4S8KMJ4_DENBC|nr:hypothetical protein K435DRAFT_878668 [Dendrothele bispora CBS 962.96]